MCSFGILSVIISSIYFILPAYFANMCPVFAGALKLPLGKPISKKYLGANKTWRGVYAGFFGALLIVFIQSQLYEYDLFMKYSFLIYSKINILLYGFLFGVGAMFGDALKSFFKRRLKIKPGRPWVPFDQIDFILGAVLFLLPVYTIPGYAFLILLLITPILHLLINITAYFLGLKEVWW